jgi:hypothetical protein
VSELDQQWMQLAPPRRELVVCTARIAPLHDPSIFELAKAREAAGIKAWAEWGAVHSSAIVDQGSPLGKTKRAAAQGITDTKNNMAAYAIVQAESHEAAAKMFANHPHFAVLPGDSVEIMECLPMPER